MTMTIKDKDQDDQEKTKVDFHEGWEWSQYDLSQLKSSQVAMKPI